MMKRNARSSVVPIMFLTVMTLALCQGCTPIDSGELGTFVRDMLLNTTAALLL